MLHYWLKALGMPLRSDTKLADAAALVHALHDQPMKAPSSSSIYKALKHVDPLQSVAALHDVKARYERVQRKAIVKLIENDLEIATARAAKLGPQKSLLRSAKKAFKRHKRSSPGKQ